MEDQITIVEKLTKSFSDLVSKKGQISIEDIQLDVINWACYEIISRRNKMLGNSIKININDMFSSILDSADETLPIANQYTSAAKTIISEYDDMHAQHNIQEIQIKSAWPPMWDVLRKYFKEFHNMTIDNIAIEEVNFKPNKFMRILKKEITQASSFSLDIKVEFKDNRKRITIILPMGLKTGCCIKKKENSDFYIGDEEDYNIEVYYKSPEKSQIIDLVIHQTKTESELHYLIE